MVLVRKTWGVGPFKVTASRKGLGVSVGNRYGRIQKGPKTAVRWTARVPGAGASIRRAFKK